MKLAGMRVTVRNCSSYKKVWNGAAVMTVLLIICLFIVLLPCIKLRYSDTMGFERPHFVSVKFQGRLANQMFQYAFLYAIAKDKEVAKIFTEDEQILTQIFPIDAKPPSDYGYYFSPCICFPVYEDEWDCAYDDKFEKIEKHSDIYFYGYFQSWKYWKHYEKDIRNVFQFQDKIKVSALKILNDIIRHGNIDLKHGDIMVGIHVRRGDYLTERKFSNFGYKLATKDYLYTAMMYFRQKFKYNKLIFIACSNDVNWTSTVLQNFSDVYIVKDNSPEVDMALLTMTNHTIMTVGTFGWWIGFLTNGTTIYYKHPFVQGSPLSKQFHTSMEEHFYPGWIGME